MPYCTRLYTIQATELSHSRSPTFKVQTQDVKKRDRVESFYLEMDLTNRSSLPIYLVKETPGSLLVKVFQLTWNRS